MEYGSIVKVNYSYNKSIIGKLGIIKSTRYDPDTFGVRIYGEWNDNSANGLFYIPKRFLVKAEDAQPKHEDIAKDHFAIKNVYFNDPATVVLWKDGTKTVVRCGENDIYDPEKGLAMAFAKKALGNKGNYFNQFKKWIPEETSSEDTLTDKTVERLNAIFRSCGACEYQHRPPFAKPCCSCCGRPFHPEFKQVKKTD